MQTPYKTSVIKRMMVFSTRLSMTEFSDRNEVKLSSERFAYYQHARRYQRKIRVLTESHPVVGSSAPDAVGSVLYKAQSNSMSRNTVVLI
ncbi:hypothetical protein EVAR_65747_1 [Eumeta japonica]|uniref:Uncharacterized protein n=1 Tax=Eumeta variegata TaxID=151549 RepID=A0A4C1ZMX5_EUMVA|nr:hypothetical protein EVAR_65747_1 [Eumeta japonica]